MKQILEFLFLSVFLLQCNSKAGRDMDRTLAVNDPSTWPIEISFEEVIKNDREVRLSEIASNIEYIPLETSDDALVSRMENKFLLTNEFVFTVCRNGLHQFDRNGTFLRKISRTGGGPGEYNMISTIFADDQERKIYIGSIGTEKILEYDFDGNFIQEFFTPMSPRYYGRLANGNFVFVKSPIGYAEDTLAYFTNSRGEIYHTLLDPSRTEELRTTRMTFSNERLLYTFENELKYKDFQNDTLFIVKDTELLPQYIILLGKYELPADKTFQAVGHDMDVYNAEASKYFRIGSVTETPSYLIFNYTTWALGKASEQLALYNKTTNHLFSLKDNVFKNDIDEIIPFFPLIYTNGKLIGHFSPDRLMDDEKGNDKWESHPQLKDIKEDDNPVMMVVTLK